jgi:hypothetical protein
MAVNFFNNANINKEAKICSKLYKPVDPQVMNYSKQLQTADHLVFILSNLKRSVACIMKGFIDMIIIHKALLMILQRNYRNL